MAAAVAPVMIATSLGSREAVDLNSNRLDLQLLENPQVSLQHCATRFGADALRSLFEKLAQRGEQAKFEEINLSDNGVGDEGARLLRLGLAGNVSLKKLLLPRAGLGAEGFASVGGLLGDDLPCLESIVLSGNLCGAAGCGGAFADGLSRNRTLRDLSLAGCRLGDEGVALLCGGLEARGPLCSHPALEHVSLQYNRLELPAAESLSKMLAANLALRYLDLSGNSLGPEGAKELVKGLEANRGRLRKLGFAMNEAKYAGCAALAKHFLAVVERSADDVGLEFLDLRHNAMSYGDVVQIREMLGKPMDDEDATWLMLFKGDRQLFLNGH